MAASGDLPRTIPRGAVVVAVDGSETAGRALAWAADYAARQDRPLVIAHAVAVIIPDTAGLSFGGGAGFARVDEQLRSDGEALVARAAAEVADSHPDVDVTTLVEHDDARQLLLRLAERASLLVMGSRGRGAFRSLLLGSVASAVTGRAACPVVVIPARTDESQP